MIIPRIIRFNTPAGYVDASADCAIAASKFVDAAVRHNYCDNGAVFEISLTDWDHDVVHYIVRSMMVPRDHWMATKPTFDFWLESIKLAVYLAMDLTDICAIEIDGDIDLTKLIDVATEHNVVPMLARLDDLVTIEMMPDLTAALAPVAIEDVIWLISNCKKARIFAACGAVSRTTIEDTQIILRHMPLKKSQDELRFILANCENLDPTSRHMIDAIIRHCETMRKVVENYKRYTAKWGV